MLDTITEVWCPVGDMEFSDKVRAKAIEDCNRVNKVCALCPQRILIVRTILAKRAKKIACLDEGCTFCS